MQSSLRDGYCLRRFMLDGFSRTSILLICIFFRSSFMEIFTILIKLDEREGHVCNELMQLKMWNAKLFIRGRTFFFIAATVLTCNYSTHALLYFKTKWHIIKNISVFFFYYFLIPFTLNGFILNCLDDMFFLT